MDNYFSLIASRSAGSNAMKPAPVAGIYESFTDSFKEEPADIDFTETEKHAAVPQNNLMIPAKDTVNIFSTNERVTKKAKQEILHTTYLSKYVQRLALIEKTANEMTEIKAEKKNPQPVNKEIHDIQDRIDSNENADKIENKIMLPASKEQQTATNHHQLLKPILAHLIPNDTVVKQVPVQNNRNNSSNNKLIIGKISVEIIPSKLPVTKVINRFTPSPATSGNSKSNRLGFGLGQL